jgi:hypothetical protein
MGQIEKVVKNSSLRLAALTNKPCANPVCQGPIEELRSNGAKVWRRTAKKYCSKRCKQEGWILAQAAKILFRLDQEQWLSILSAIIDHQKMVPNPQSDTATANP